MYGDGAVGHRPFVFYSTIKLPLQNLDFTATTVFCCLKGHLLECELQKGPLKTQQF
jgi:hypothetical protein